MGATVLAYIANGATPTLTDVETGATWGRDDNITSTTPIPIPTSAGTHFSWVKWLFLDVTVTATTTISNRRIAWSAAATTGLFGWFEGQATYTANNGTQGTAAGDYPADAVANGATPGGPGSFTLMAASNQVYDASSGSAGSTGKNGLYCMTVVAVDDTYTGGAGASTSLPNILMTYDEQ